MKYISIEYKFSDKPTPNRIEHPLVQLLESLHSQGSIGGAAKNLGLSYRHVWGELKSWEARLEANLVVWGQNGKAAVLTHEAVQYLNAVYKSQIELEPSISQIKEQVMKNTRIIRWSNHEVALKQTSNSWK